jgi:hypothetical protein
MVVPDAEPGQHDADQRDERPHPALEPSFPWSGPRPRAGGLDAYLLARLNRGDAAFATPAQPP